MREGGPKEKNPDHVFKCKDCGAVTRPRNGWNGEPDPHRCGPGCRCNHGDWSPGGVSGSYRENYDRILWDGSSPERPRTHRDDYRENYDRIFGPSSIIETDPNSD